jgi:hypothetical protein
MQQIYDTIDRQPYQWVVVLVAGVGFFLDGYTVSFLFCLSKDLTLTEAAIREQHGSADDRLCLLAE